MDFKQIQELLKIVNRSNIGELYIEQNDFRITIKQKEEKVQNSVTAQPVFTAASQVAAPPSAQPQQAPAMLIPSAEQTVAAVTKADNFITIKSPMIGTFYRKASPDKPLFIEVGDEVAPGKVVCIIEAMKLFNEIESEVSGKVVKILVEDASPVEYDQPLFLVEPA